MSDDPGPGFVSILFGHAAFQQLHAASELGLFDLLAAEGALAEPSIADRLHLSERATGLLLLGTGALRLTEKVDGRHRNGPVVADFIASGRWPVLRDIIEFQARIAYVPASDYTQSLREDRNVGIRHFPGDTDDLYSRLSGVPGLEELFYRCMSSWSTLSNPVLVESVDYTGVRRILDVGGGDAVNAVALARAQPHVRITVLDRAPAIQIARETIERSDLGDRIDTCVADIFEDEYPQGHDCVLFAHQLVIWSPEQNLRLLAKAHRALSPGGRVLVFNAMSDDDGSGPLYSALDNVYFATLPFAQSTLYPWSAYRGWLSACGFTDIHEVRGDSWTPHGVVEGRR